MLTGKIVNTNFSYIAQKMEDVGGPWVFLSQLPLALPQLLLEQLRRLPRSLMFTEEPGQVHDGLEASLTVQWLGFPPHNVSQGTD